MQDSDREHLSALHHVLVLLGGGIGGHLGAVIVAMVFFPVLAPKSASDLLNSLCCFPLGAAVGYGPGILICNLLIRVKGSPWLGFLAAVLCSGIIQAYAAFVLYAAAAR